LPTTIENIRRKLRAITATARDSGATEHERANARALKARLEQHLKDAGAPEGDWTDQAFRLGRWARRASDAAGENWTDGAFRLGKTLRRGLKKWSSQ
jgi:hypothetical protein